MYCETKTITRKWMLEFGVMDKNKAFSILKCSLFFIYEMVGLLYLNLHRIIAV